MKHKKKYSKKRLKRQKRDFTSRVYKEFRHIVSLRDERQCIICRLVDHRKTKGRISTHHLCPWRDCVDKRYEPQNGCLLCWRHHKEVTNNEYLWIDLLEELVRKSEFEYIRKYGISPYERKEG